MLLLAHDELPRIHLLKLFGNYEWAPLLIATSRQNRARCTLIVALCYKNTRFMPVQRSRKSARQPPTRLRLCATGYKLLQDVR